MLRTLALGAALFCAPFAHAGYILDTGTPSYPYGGLIVEEGNQQLGMSFTLSGPGAITAADAFLGSFHSNTFVVELHAGSPDGALLTAATAAVTDTDGAHWVRFDFADVLVGAGSYTLTFTGEAGGEGFAPFDAPNPGAISATWIRSDLTDWEWLNVVSRDLAIGLRVEGAAVPEPTAASLILAGLGALSFVGLARRRARVCTSAVASPRSDR